MAGHELKPEKITHPFQPKARKTVVLISYLKRSDEVVTALKELGFNAKHL